jgi:hypothetical protein
MNENPHPAGARLDAVATGDADAAAIAHVAECAACAAYVDELRGAIETFAEKEGTLPDGFVDRVARARTARKRPRRFSPWVAGATSGLALAAAGLLLVRVGPGSRPGDTPSAPSEGPIRFKGGSQVAVIVEREGRQSRETGVLRIAPGDRIRAEIAVDHDTEVTAGVLTDGGEWAVLQPPAYFTAGTHFSERSISFDARVEDGWVVVGPPPAVEQARRTRDFGSVQALRVHSTVP